MANLEEARSRVDPIGRTEICVKHELTLERLLDIFCRVAYRIKDTLDSLPPEQGDWPDLLSNRFLMFLEWKLKVAEERDDGRVVSALTVRCWRDLLISIAIRLVCATSWTTDTKTAVLCDRSAGVVPRLHQFTSHLVFSYKLPPWKEPSVRWTRTELDLLLQASKELLTDTDKISDGEARVQLEVLLILLAVSGHRPSNFLGIEGSSFHGLCTQDVRVIQVKRMVYSVVLTIRYGNGSSWAHQGLQPQVVTFNAVKHSDDIIFDLPSRIIALCVHRHELIDPSSDQPFKDMEAFHASHAGTFLTNTRAPFFRSTGCGSTARTTMEPLTCSGANAQLRDLSDLAKLKPGSLNAFRRPSGTVWKQTLFTDAFILLLLDQGPATDTTTAPYMRDAQEQEESVASFLGDHDMSPQDVAVFQSALIKFTSPAMQAYALQHEHQDHQVQQPLRAKACAPRIVVESEELDQACDADAACKKFFASWTQVANAMRDQKLITLVGEGHARYLGVDLGRALKKRCRAKNEKRLYGNAVASRELYRKRRNELRNQLRREKKQRQDADAREDLSSPTNSVTEDSDIMTDEAYNQNKLALWRASDSALSELGLTAKEISCITRDRSKELSTIEVHDGIQDAILNSAMLDHPARKNDPHVAVRLRAFAMHNYGRCNVALAMEKLAARMARTDLCMCCSLSVPPTTFSVASARRHLVNKHRNVIEASMSGWNVFTKADLLPGCLTLYTSQDVAWARAALSVPLTPNRMTMTDEEAAATEAWLLGYTPMC